MKIEKLFAALLLLMIVFSLCSCELIKEAPAEDSTVYTLVLESEVSGFSSGAISIVNGKADASSFVPVTYKKGSCNVQGYAIYFNNEAIKILNADGTFAQENIPGFVKDNCWVFQGNTTLFALLDKQRVGGKVFYKNGKTESSSEGIITIGDSTYVFYDKNGKVIYDFSMIPEESGVIANTDNGFNPYYYTMIQRGKDEAFFVAYTTKDGKVSLYPDNEKGGVYQWGNLGKSAYSDHSKETKAIGKGKEITGLCLESDLVWEDGTKAEEYIQSRGSVKKESIFNAIKTINSGEGLNGCADWFIGSFDEMGAVKDSNNMPLIDDADFQGFYTCNEDESVGEKGESSVVFAVTNVSSYYIATYWKDSWLTYSQDLKKYFNFGFIPIRSF